MIYNLLFNAIDACSAGDSVTLNLYAGEHESTDCLVVECRDTGPGIPEKVREKLFTKDAISTKPGGTGLGTRIIANVVRAHGGSLALESEEGQGTTIRCCLPWAQPV
jgi:signal transduction histidine kinase